MAVPAGGTYLFQPTAAFAVPESIITKVTPVNMVALTAPVATTPMKWG